MSSLPLISIITPSFNQGRYLRDTLRSLVEQNYPRLEVIIQEGGSTDGAVEIAREFAAAHPDVFHLYLEKDSGQADALNRGFARARGEILGFLNSDDTLYPGTLLRVAKEIDPARNRHVVMGRCIFTGEGSSYVGVEHPAEYTTHFEHLAIWKRGFNTIPQPSVFWHRTVWERCGGFDVNEHHALDYDLFCRFSRHFRFHRVDAVWSTYRMHAISKSSQKTESEVLALTIAVSRRYWGAWYSPLRWRCEFSHWLHDKQVHEHARHHARHAEEAAKQGRRFTAAVEFCRTFFYSPRMARDRLLYAWLSVKQVQFFNRLIWRDATFTGRHGDSWIGPIFRQEMAVPGDAKSLLIVVQHSPQGYHQRVVSTLKINRRRTARRIFTQPEQFAFMVDAVPYRQSTILIEIANSTFFIPRLVHNTPDDRKLSLQLLETRIE